MRYRYAVVLERDPEGTGYAVTVPALPGCVTDGDDPEEALEMVREALTGYHAALGALGRPLPGPAEGVRVEPAPEDQVLVGRVEWARGPRILEAPSFTPGELRAALEQQGFRLAHETPRHLHLASQDGTRLVSVPTRLPHLRPHVLRALAAYLGIPDARLRQQLRLPPSVTRRRRKRLAA